MSLTLIIAELPTQRQSYYVDKLYQLWSTFVRLLNAINTIRLQDVTIYDMEGDVGLFLVLNA